jgi:hypothetical protein
LRVIRLKTYCYRTIPIHMAVLKKHKFLKIKL